jgi:hypothetical protein
MALLAPFASIRKMAAAAFPLIKPGLTLLPWLVRDKFDNIGKAPSLRCACARYQAGIEDCRIW